MPRTVGKCMNCQEIREIVSHGLCANCNMADRRAAATRRWGKPAKGNTLQKKAQAKTAQGLITMMVLLNQFEESTFIDDEVIDNIRHLIKPYVDRIGHSLEPPPEPQKEGELAEALKGVQAPPINWEPTPSDRSPAPQETTATEPEQENVTVPPQDLPKEGDSQ
jgi:hypothetical protein